ncbi:MAG: endonuclease/exonuclease/phosphatase family protein [Deltaproteobacteria bacterium]|nr:endonuclease/exonuclease/phosphatase family protein [Deltaproteobacteria bacterium]
MNMISSKKWRLFFIWMVVTVFVFPLSSAIAKRGGNHKTQVKVMTRNLYLGADIFRVVEAAQTDPKSIPLVVADVFETVQATNFYDRAEAIADEVLKTKPDVVGIQEASTYYIQTPGDFLEGNPVQAGTVFIDFYSVLDDALKARGLYYDAYIVTNADIELPMVDPGSPTTFSDVRLVDHDMILVKKPLKSWEVAAGNYMNQLAMDIAGTPVTFSRGYLAVDVKIKREEYRFVNTHLEVSSSPDSVFRLVQSAQMQELLTIVGELSVDGPPQVIMVGDFNSSPDDVPGTVIHPVYGPLPYVPPYLLATGAGYFDSWLLQKRYDEGYTSGFDEYVSDPNAELTTRIDHIFLGPNGYKIEKVKSVVVGDDVKDMTPNGLWPSDHAGVVAKIKFSQKNYPCPAKGKKAG